MAQQRISIHGEWSSRWTFILAATGSAVGLGNIWKFPYIAGENGGGAFVLIYLLCIAMIGIPVMMAEIMLGRRGKQSPINAMRTLAQEARQHHVWGLLGWSGMIAGFLILSYYSVIAGWTLAYVPRMAAGLFQSDWLFANASPERISQMFQDFTSNPLELIIWHTAIMGLTMFIVARGVRGGLERAVNFLMPGLFLILFLLIGYAVSTGAFMQGMGFLFSADFSKLTGQSVLAAMGQAFFTLSLGMGAIMVYGAYLPRDVPITSTSVTIAGADTLVALLAGLAIFPLVFANGLAPDSGPSLIFITLPNAFGHMAGGAFFGTLFFLLLVFAALTSAISIIEPAVSWLVESRNFKRPHAALFCGVLIWLTGLLTVFSFNLLADFKPIAEKTLFELIDYLTSNIMLPLGGLFIAIFAAWAMHHDAHEEELGLGKADISYRTWLFLIRFVTPVGVIFIFLSAIGVFG